ncbi:solute carrier family 22 member 13 [Aplysia californica]|uniref:Solute carrier family 22 member 13 n=1 Tax=Aplysia californica TaxID=6500 RepID=A0ABM0JGE1_APLCA|nr:solute carrier family 22 member 13 [Aplysia californica]
MDMETVLRAVGTSGRFQIVVVLVTQAARVSAIWSLFFITFGIYEPPWHCDNDASSNATSPWTNGSEVITNNSCDVIDSCDVKFQEGSSTLVTEWRLVCDQTWVSTTLATIQMVGVTLGAVIGGQTGDLFGRKLSMYGYTLILSIANIAIIFSPSWEVYAAIVFIIGICISGIFPIAFVYAVEFLGPRGRDVLTALPIWNAAVGSLGVLTFFIRNWKHLHLITGVYSGIVFLSVFWTPESLRWLYAHGKIEEAHAVAKKIGHVNGREVPDFELLNNAEKDTTGEKVVSRKYTYLDLFKNRRIALLVVKVVLIMFTSNLAYLFFALGVKVFSGDFYVNFMLYSLAEIPIVLVVALVMRFLQRRHGCMFLLSVACLSCLLILAIFYTVEDESARGTAITALGLIAKSFIQGFCQISNVLNAELFPTVLRGLTIGLMVTAANIGGVIAPVLIPQNPGFFPITFSILTAALLVSILMVWLLPETKNRPLEDVTVSKSSEKHPS